MAEQSNDTASTPADAWAGVRDRMAVAASKAARDPAAVTLIAVSKKQPIDRVAAVLATGQRVFGENIVQEAHARWSGLRGDYPDLKLHLIGPLQTNKVRQAVALFDVIETVDRPKLARALAREMARTGRRPHCFIQVNTGEEPQKAGVLPDDLEALIDLAWTDLDLPLVGLMCIPPEDDNPALHFAFLAELARRNNLPFLSMGMSGDFETAIRFGATHIRVGSRIFGARQRPMPAI